MQKVAVELKDTLNATYNNVSINILFLINKYSWKLTFLTPHLKTLIET